MFVIHNVTICYTYNYYYNRIVNLTYHIEAFVMSRMANVKYICNCCMYCIINNITTIILKGDKRYQRKLSTKISRETGGFRLVSFGKKLTFLAFIITYSIFIRSHFMLLERAFKFKSNFITFKLSKGLHIGRLLS